MNFHRRGHRYQRGRYRGHRGQFRNGRNGGRRRRGGSRRGRGYYNRETPGSPPPTRKVRHDIYDEDRSYSPKYDNSYGSHAEKNYPKKPQYTENNTGNYFNTQDRFKMERPRNSTKRVEKKKMDYTEFDLHSKTEKSFHRNNLRGKNEPDSWLDHRAIEKNQLQRKKSPEKKKLKNDKDMNDFFEEDYGNEKKTKKETQRTYENNFYEDVKKTDEDLDDLLFFEDAEPPSRRKRATGRVQFSENEPKKKAEKKFPQPKVQPKERNFSRRPENTSYGRRYYHKPKPYRTEPPNDPPVEKKTMNNIGYVDNSYYENQKLRPEKPPQRTDIGNSYKPPPRKTIPKRETYSHKVLPKMRKKKLKVSEEEIKIEKKPSPPPKALPGDYSSDFDDKEYKRHEPERIEGSGEGNQDFFGDDNFFDEEDGEFWEDRDDPEEEYTTTNFDEVSKFYNQWKQITYERRRLEELSPVEFMATKFLIVEYIKRINKNRSRPFRVLDIGCGVGHYAEFVLTKFSNVRISLADITQRFIEETLKRIKRLGKRNLVENVRNCSVTEIAKNFPKNHYDLVLCLGPLYHLVSYNERMMALSQVTNVLKSNGYVFFAGLNRVRMMRYAQILTVDNNYFTEGKNFDNFINDGVMTKKLDLPLGVGYCHTWKGFCEEMHSQRGLRVDKTLGIQSFAHQRSWERLTKKNKFLFLRYVLLTGDLPEGYGSSDHFLGVCQKRRENEIVSFDRKSQKKNLPTEKQPEKNLLEKKKTREIEIEEKYFEQPTPPPQIEKDFSLFDKLKPKFRGGKVVSREEEDGEEEDDDIMDNDLDEKIEVKNQKVMENMLEKMLMGKLSQNEAEIIEGNTDLETLKGELNSLEIVVDGETVDDNDDFFDDPAPLVTKGGGDVKKEELKPVLEKVSIMDEVDNEIDDFFNDTIVEEDDGQEEKDVEDDNDPFFDDFEDKIPKKHEEKSLVPEEKGGKIGQIIAEEIFKGEEKEESNADLDVLGNGDEALNEEKETEIVHPKVNVEKKKLPPKVNVEKKLLVKMNEEEKLPPKVNVEEKLHPKVNVKKKLLVKVNEEEKLPPKVNVEEKLHPKVNEGENQETIPSKANSKVKELKSVEIVMYDKKGRVTVEISQFGK